MPNGDEREIIGEAVFTATHDNAPRTGQRLRATDRVLPVRFAFAWFVTAIALIASACRFPATEVVVTLGTDAPIDRTLTITASVRGANAIADAGRLVGTWRRGGATSQITLPASFAITPAGDHRTEAVTLEIEASLAATATQPVRTFRRVARFAFTPRVSASVPIFLAVSCGNSSIGCTSVAADACTVSIRCADMGMTCGDRGECISTDVTPVPIQPGTLVDGAASFDVPVDAVAADTVVPNDVTADNVDAADVSLTNLFPPRQIAPLSTTHVATPRPVLRWALAAGTDGATIELSQRPDFSAGTMRIDATGTSLRVPALAPGAWFWRLYGRTGSITGTPASYTWVMRVGHIAGSTDAAYGSDLDGDLDGLVDFMIAAPNVAGGIVHAYDGAASPLVSTVQLSTADSSAHFGRAISSGADVNGDGYGDAIIGAPAANGGIGAVSVYFGSGSGFTSGLAHTITGVDGVNGNFGQSVAGLGDVNGDGYGDIALMSSGAISEGVVYVYLGTSMGPEATPSIVLRGTDGNLTGLGRTMAQHVDVNGDGYSDLVAGAPGASLTPRVYVFLGGPSGLATTPVQHIDAPDSGSIQFAQSLASAGDVNGDGRSDVIVGAPQFNMQTGRAYLYLGTASGLSTTASVTLTGTDGTGTFFGTAVEGAGDLDNDGFDELAVTATAYASATGRVYVFRGNSMGVASTASWTLDGPDGAGGHFGSSVAGNLDVDNDGHGELLIGAPFVGASATEGRAYLFTSGPTGLLTASWQVAMSPDGAGGMFGAALR